MVYCYYCTINRPFMSMDIPAIHLNFSNKLLLRFSSQFGPRVIQLFVLTPNAVHGHHAPVASNFREGPQCGREAQHRALFVCIHRVPTDKFDADVVVATFAANTSLPSWRTGSYLLLRMNGRYSDKWVTVGSERIVCA